ncbi:methyltransferase TYW3-domain-containing protein [Hypoxylon crocopeplum]|nr:methyltransferase TYW3-domain-containing protein [Hypoxylon crocopeplum]
MKDRLLPAPPPTFAQRKTRILEQLAVPDAEYTDASPKGSVDAGIRDLIGEVNALDGFVTTSSCAGRVSVFLEGSKRAAAEEGKGEDEGEGEGERRKLAGVGGKGGGGAWLFVSHDPVPLEDGDDGDMETLLGLQNRSEKGDGTGRVVPGDDTAQDVAATRFVHFKFEPMIFHVLTASPEHAQQLLKCGLQAGFRESGAVSLTAPAGEQHATPMVAIRSMGLAFESLIGYQPHDGKLQYTVSSEYLQTLIRIANERFSENKKRIDRFRAALTETTRPPPPKKGDDGLGWEDAQARRERKRAEGLRRKAELQGQKQGGDAPATEDVVLDIPSNAELT